MKIAVPYENGQIFQHFGHTQSFKIYTAEGKELTESVVIGTNGSGHGALSAFLKERGVSALVCGGIGGGAKAALAEAGIALYPGVCGSADEAVRYLLEGTLLYNADAACDHHGHEHRHGEDCGQNGCRHGHCNE